MNRTPPGVSGSPPQKSALSVRGVSKSFASVPALRDVHFDLTAGTVHCLIGGNGSGKSTMIKVLAGVHQADAGDIEIRGRRLQARDMTPTHAKEAGLHFVHQQQSTFPDLTVAENLAIGFGFETAATRISWSRLHRRAAEILERFEIEAQPTTLLRNLRPATQMMVSIARALQGEDDMSDDVLVLDEPTAPLPLHEVEILLSALKSYAQAGQTILFVTHRLSEVLDVADNVTAFRDGRAVRTVARAGLDHDKLAEMIVGRPVDQLIPQTTANRVNVHTDTVLCARKLAGGSIKGIDLTVRKGEIVGVAGLLGSGRTRLLRMLFGASPVTSGSIEIDGKSVSFAEPRHAMEAGVAFVPEDRRNEAAFSDMSVEENLGISVVGKFFRGGRMRRRTERSEAEALSSRFFIKTPSLDAPLAALSGGNQQKVILARWIRRSPKLLLLDEPTQGVDVGSRGEIWQLVREAVLQGSAAIVVSSDMEELPRVCDRVVVIKDGVVVSELSGHDLTENRLQHIMLTGRAA